MDKTPKTELEKELTVQLQESENKVVDLNKRLMADWDVPGQAVVRISCQHPENKKRYVTQRRADNRKQLVEELRTLADQIEKEEAETGVSS